MENKMFDVPVELFDMDKVMINKQKVCKAWCTITDNREGKNDVYSLNGIEPNYQVREELEKKIAELQPYLCDIHSISKDHRTKVLVTGLECSGIGDKATFLIHGVNISDSEQRMNFKTCKVHYTGEYYGFEGEVSNIIEKIKVLVHGYIFENQKAQLTIFDGPEDATEVEENEETE